MTELGSRKTEFERRAQLLLPHFKPDIRYSMSILPPPFITEFFGPASGGKTTLIKELDKFWKRQGYHTWHPQEGAEAIRYLDRSTPFYNITTGTYALQILSKECRSHTYDHVFFDRCMFDAYVWMKYWNKKGKLSEEMMHMLQESFLAHADQIDLAFMIVCDPSVSIARETKNELTSQLGQTTNLETLQKLAAYHREAYDELHERFRQIVVLDTTNLDEKLMVQKVATIMLDKLEERIIRYATAG